MLKNDLLKVLGIPGTFGVVDRQTGFACSDARVQSLHDFRVLQPPMEGRIVLMDLIEHIQQIRCLESDENLNNLDE